MAIKSVFDYVGRPAPQGGFSVATLTTDLLSGLDMEGPIHNKVLELFDCPVRAMRLTLELRFQRGGFAKFENLVRRLDDRF